ncbi:hypothetical protein MUK42_35765 [Musa troglodytarum]|uniref:Uncharacterized protein n=1 Tax=Musa troglodytarum TaxID=320322 RepID=A0A9E7JEZ6_9LILI|nr:hypothetical protein MUK42_35765 [Musa troglodytarum]
MAVWNEDVFVQRKENGHDEETHHHHQALSGSKLSTKKCSFLTGHGRTIIFYPFFARRGSRILFPVPTVRGFRRELGGRTLRVWLL